MDQERTDPHLVKDLQLMAIDRKEGHLSLGIGHTDRLYICPFCRYLHVSAHMGNTNWI